MIERTLKEKIKDLREENSNLKASEISRKVLCSRERVRQILVELNLPTKIEPQKIICKNCETNPVIKNRKFCSDDCRKNFSIVMVNCFTCETDFSKSKSQYKAAIKRNYKHHFCNRVCLGSYLGNNFGFAVTKRKLK